MTAPAIVLVTSGPEEPGVAETLTTIVTSLRHARRDLKVHIGRVDGELESLLDRIRTKTLECLLFIPWTLQAQTVLHIQQAAERRQFFFFRMSFSCITNHRFVQKLIILMQR